MPNSRIIALLGIVFLLSSSCRTIRELKNFLKSDFRLEKVNQLDLNAIDLLNVNSFSDLKLSDGIALGKAYAGGSLPLNITYNVEVRNPNEEMAALEKVDWVLEVDKTDVVNGTSTKRIEVPPNGGIANFPIAISLNVREILGKESLKSLVNLVSAVKGDNQEDSRIRLKIKPRFKIAGITMSLGYIKIGKTFESSQEVK